MDEESIKLAFYKVKEDINFLNEEILNLKIILNNLTTQLTTLKKGQDMLLEEISTLRQINKAITAIPTHNPTVPLEMKGFRQTDRQTNRQTDRHIPIQKTTLKTYPITYGKLLKYLNL